MSQFTNILVATDGSRSSEAAVEKGLELASQTGAGLTFLHVVEPTLWRGARGAAAVPAAVVEDAHGDPVLDDALEQARAAGVQAETERVSGGDTRCIVAVADETGADLIVVGDRPSRPRLRSVARSVVRSAHCPVYIARAA